MIRLQQIPPDAPACRHLLHHGDRYQCGLTKGRCEPAYADVRKLATCPTFVRAYRQGEQPPSPGAPPTKPPCVHLGQPIGETVPCKPCQDPGRKLKLHTCSVFGKCTLGETQDDAHGCRGCDRYQAPSVTQTKAILLTGGIGDAIALEGQMPPAEREQIETIYYACPAWREISGLFQALPNFPRLKNHIILQTRGKVYYSAAEVIADHGPLNDVEDWSIKTRFPLARPYAGSSLLTHRIAETTRRQPYVVIVPASRGFGQWADRDFAPADWSEAIRFLDLRDLQGIVVGKTPTSVPAHERLMNRQGKTTLAESIEILKAANGYLGIDSCLSVLAAKLFGPSCLAIKSVWGHCYANRQTYYAPHADFSFLQKTLVCP